MQIYSSKTLKMLILFEKKAEEKASAPEMTMLTHRHSPKYE